MSEQREVVIRDDDGDIILGVYPSPTQAKQAANDWNKKYGRKETDTGGAYVRKVR